MNPGQALASWINKMAEPESTATAGADQTVAEWSKATGIALDPERTVIGRGVRDLLSATFSHVLKRGEELWLPEDVYPVYWELARCAQLNARPFVTLPQPNWDFLAQTSARSAIVLPIPLSPLGRWPAEGEIAALNRWLLGSRHRFLILDAVYTFNFRASRGIWDSFVMENSEQCMMLWSCSKSWLMRGLLGLAAVPGRLASSLEGHAQRPTETDLGKIHGVLTARPDLPRWQQEAFNREWRRLAPDIRSAAPDWQPPAAGYFSIVSAPFATLLDEHDILSVPASVFGTRHNDFSIVTCLHDLAAQEKGACAS
jgi:aspartate/methionine/tyrosine aminotransferase